MLELPSVTLVCIDTANHALALRAMSRSLSGIRFARAVFATAAVPGHVAIPDGIDVVPIAPLTSRDAYSHCVLKELLPLVATAHVLVVQWDGYVVNPDAWTDDFLACDYLGAPWFWREDDMRVGNGGFSLRSRRLLEALQDPRIDLVEAEDNTICRTFRPLLEREYGIRFGDEPTATRFAFEADHSAGRPFGFHGLFNFHSVVPPAELRELPGLFSDAIARSPQADQLLHNCMLAGMWAQGAAVGRRILTAKPGDPDVQAIVLDAESQLAHLSAAAIDLPPRLRTPEEFVERGLRALADGEPIAARREFRAALALAPTHPVALQHLALTYARRGSA